MALKECCHAVLGTQSGEAYANLALRIMRAIFNFVARTYEDEQGYSLITENSVKHFHKHVHGIT